MRGGGGDDDGSDIEGTHHNISHEAHRTFGNEQLTTDQKQLYVLGLKAMLEVRLGGGGGYDQKQLYVLGLKAMLEVGLGGGGLRH